MLVDKICTYCKKGYKGTSAQKFCSPTCRCKSAVDGAIGFQCGSVTVLGDYPDPLWRETVNGRKHVLAKVVCSDCKRIRVMRLARILRKEIETCGCRVRLKGISVGARFGSWTVIDATPKQWIASKRNGVMVPSFLCKCDCGTERVVRGRILGKKVPSSCGCLRRISAAKVCRSRRKNKTPIPHYFYNRIKEGAAARGISFSEKLTEEALYGIFQDQGCFCALSGKSLTFAADAKKNRAKGTASLDRIDSSKGYTKKNVQWIHKDLNRMKGKLSDEEFIEWCRCVAVHNNRSKKTGE